MTSEKAPSAPGACGVPLARGGTCQMREGHYADRRAAEKGHGKPSYWRRRELCPDKDKHAEQVYGDRLGQKFGNITPDGVAVIPTIDGVEASRRHKQELCPTCELFVIWTPRSSDNAEVPR